MIGFLATVGVISQMALLSLGAAPEAAMSVGLAAGILWIFHALRLKDRWLLITNAAVAGFAIYGIL